MFIVHTFIRNSEAAKLQLPTLPSVTLTLEQRRRSRQLLTLDDRKE